jgi:hypothetical protein
MVWDAGTYFEVALGVLGASPIFLAFGWDAWERLRAMYVPQAEVDRLAANCIAACGVCAREYLECNIDRARRRGETGEYWLQIRVLESLKQVETTGGATAEQTLHIGADAKMGCPDKPGNDGCE